MHRLLTGFFFDDKLKFRVPSMLIRRDRVMSQQQHLESLHNMQAFLSTSSSVSPPGASITSVAGPGSLSSPGSDTSSATIPRVVPTSGAPTTTQNPNPLQQWESLQKQSLDADRKELVEKASGGAGPYGTYVAHNVLHV
jgi:hypothetical protein